MHACIFCQYRYEGGREGGREARRRRSDEAFFRLCESRGILGIVLRRRTPLLTFEVKSKRLLCINCQTEELLVYEATYHAEVLQTGYIMYTRTPQGQRVRRGNCEL